MKSFLFVWGWQAAGLANAEQFVSMSSDQSVDAVSDELRNDQENGQQRIKPSDSSEYAEGRRGFSVRPAGFPEYHGWKFLNHVRR